MAAMAQLVPPTTDYRDSYIQAIRELQAEGRGEYASQAQLQTNFAQHVSRERHRAAPSETGPLQVPETILWLVDDDEFLGRLELRHRLTEHLRQIGGHIGYTIRPSRRREGWGTEILRLGLGAARDHGFDRVLLTCDPDNIASKKIIEANGGVFENRVQLDRAGVHFDKLRYWIEL